MSPKSKARIIRPDEIPSEEIAGGARHRGILTQARDGTGVTVYKSHIRPGKSHDWHSHEVDEVMYIISGEGRYELEGGELRYKAGEFVFMPRGTQHRNTCTTDEDVHMVAIFNPPVE
ncbi:MAG: cupin domain-containing protein [bacterium]|nr:cupin domain-containing protein [bacterium]